MFLLQERASFAPWRAFVARVPPPSHSVKLVALTKVVIRPTFEGFKVIQ